MIILSLLLLAVLLLAVTALFYGARLYLRRSLPQTRGAAQVSGLKQEVGIQRDTNAVPHIYAGNKLDAYFGLGYAHAQDRLWQMDFQRRMGRGRVSEILGRRTVALDRFMRTLGIASCAQQTWDQLPRETKAVIDAYVSGINALMDQPGGFVAPPEFVILRARPERWSGVDVVILSKVLAWSLAGTYVTELLRQDLSEAVGAERARQLVPFYFDEGRATPSAPPANASGKAAAATASEEHSPSMIGEGIGSNLWAVSGARSSSGAALLANDPHLGTSIPNTWYLAHLSTNDMDIIGATVPGLPVFVSGRNRWIAWGVTNLNPDVQDLYREKLDDKGSHAEFAGVLVPVQLRTEEIQVKKSAPVTMQVQVTRHGPIISSVLQGETELHRKDRGPREPLALQWTGLATDDTSLAALLQMNHAETWEQFTQALALHVAPPLNFGYADVRGNIGLHAAGRIPVRKAGDGSTPSEGWSGDYEWTGFIPFDELPQSFNPPEGYLVSTNCSPAPQDYPHLLGRDWVDPIRKKRIAAMLEAKPRLTVEDHAAIQGDTYSRFAQEMLALLLPLVEPQNSGMKDARMKEVLERLAGWDCRMQAASVEASIFAAWMLRLPRALLRDEIGAGMLAAYEYWTSYVSRFLRNALAGTVPVKTELRQTARQTLQEALEFLEKKFGGDLNAWKWERLHLAVFPHIPFQGAGPLRRFFSRSIGTGGYWDTVNIGGVTPREPFSYRTVANYRQIVDLGNEDAGIFAQAVGQSGHFLSRHYDDFLADWKAVRFRPMRFGREAVNQMTSGTLMLQPAAARQDRKSERQS